MELPELKTLNLTAGEIKVYSAILNLGTSTLNKIHERVGMERRAIYDIINKLIQKGLITYTIERGKKTFKCAPPSKLKEIIQEKKAELENFEKILPQINQLYNSSKPQVSFEIFRGKEGIKTVFEDMLNHKNIYAIGGGFYITKELPYYWPNYNQRRIKAKSVWHNLVRSELRNSKTSKIDLVNVRFLPKEFSGNPVVIIVYGNKVVNLLWGEEWFAFMIESKEVVENYKKYHKFLWEKIAKN
ncbi:MAG TPA: helix-turn-helix domain-containing protein [Candidatus Nanoarchaeia archaeon]|nr:helix-turn-helix domain-containing protein [Candidatus Nanoarchaeia archaeon]